LSNSSKKLFSNLVNGFSESAISYSIKDFIQKE